MIRNIQLAGLKMLSARGAWLLTALASATLLPAAQLMAASPPATPLASSGLRPAELAALVKVLQAEARTYVAQHGIGSDQQTDLRDVSYDSSSLAALQAAVNSRGESAAELYIANRLLEPLERSPLPVIRAVLPAARNLSRRCGRFIDPPHYEPARLETLRIPDFDPKAPTATQLRKLQDVQALRDQKVAADMPSALHDQQAYRLEQSIMVLMLKAGDRRLDQELLEMVASQEEQDSWLFADALLAIKAEAPMMTPQRAWWFRDELLKLQARRSGSYFAGRLYVCKGKMIVPPDENSRFDRIYGSPAQLISAATGALASRASLSSDSGGQQ